MGEDAEWSPVEAQPSVPPSPCREPSFLRDAVPCVPRSTTVGTFAESTPTSARTAKAVKADLESSRPAQVVKEDTRVVWVDNSFLATERRKPAAPSGWYGPVSRAGNSGPPPVSRVVTQSGVITIPGSVKQSRHVSKSWPATQEGMGLVFPASTGLTASGRARGRARGAYFMQPITVAPTDPRLQATPGRRVIMEHPSPRWGEGTDPAILTEAAH